MKIALSGVEGEFLRTKGIWLREAGQILGTIIETDPMLARELSLEALSVEARGILQTGALGRVQGLALEGDAITSEDLERLTRLETVVATADHRVSEKLSEIERKEAGAGLERLGNLASLAGKIVDLAKQVF